MIINENETWIEYFSIIQELPPKPQQTKVQYYTKSQFYESSEVDKNSVVDITSVKLVGKSSVLFENTGLKLEELDKKTVHCKYLQWNYSGSAFKKL